MSDSTKLASGCGLFARFERCFVEARHAFAAQFYAEFGKHQRELEEVLRTRESLLNIGVDVLTDVHSITVRQDGDHLLIRDTNHKAFIPVAGWDRIRQRARLLDCIIHIRK